MKDKDKQIIELTHALNDCYDVFQFLKDNYVMADFTTQLIDEAMQQADKLLEGN